MTNLNPDLKPQRIFWDSGRVWRARDMHEVSHRQSIIKFCRLDLSGDAKQTSHVRNTSAPLFLSFSPVSELLFELLYCKRTEMLYELFEVGDLNGLRCFDRFWLRDAERPVSRTSDFATPVHQVLQNLNFVRSD